MATRLLPVLVTACALAGCGGEERSQEDEVRATLTRFERAAAARDYEALCERVLAPRLVATIERVGLTCEVALEEGFGDLRDPRLAVGTVDVAGDRATAQVRSSAAGQEPSEDTLELVRTGGGWRIASLGAGAR